MAITAPELPGAVFSSVAALRANVRHALDIEHVMAAFEADRDETALHVDLDALGFTVTEINAIVANPAGRPRCGYA